MQPKFINFIMNTINIYDIKIPGKNTCRKHNRIAFHKNIIRNECI